jgi:hypothetical protein
LSLNYEFQGRPREGQTGAFIRAQPGIATQPIRIEESADLRGNVISQNLSSSALRLFSAARVIPGETNGYGL